MIPGQSFESDPRKVAISQVSEFEYDDSLRLARKLLYNINSGNLQLSGWQTYDYEDNKIIKLNSFNAQGELILYNVYTYDENDNIISDSFYTNFSGIKLERMMTCEFDNKNNPYRVFEHEGTPGKFTNRNNITSETYINYGYNEPPITKLNSYEYNTLGYPVKINTLACIYGK